MLHHLQTLPDKQLYRVTIHCAAILLAGLIGHASAGYPVIFSHDFEDTTLSKSLWSPQVNYEFGPGKTGRGISIEKSTGGYMGISTPMDVNEVKGGAVILQATIKAENVTPLTNDATGILVELRVTPDNGDVKWYLLKDSGYYGTTEWVEHARLLAIPDNAVSMRLFLAVSNISGKVWFDDIKVRLAKDPATFPAARDPNLPIDKYRDVPLLRGMTFNDRLTQDGVIALAREWLVNASYYHFPNGSKYYPLGLATPKYESLLNDELNQLDRVIAWHKAAGIKLILNLHSLARSWGRSVETQNRLIETWKTIALRYKEEPTLLAYALVNEPHDKDVDFSVEGVLVWEDIAEKVAREIRAIDSRKIIILNPFPWALPRNFSHLRPIDFSIPRVVYAVHMYVPHCFTHQLVRSYYKQSYVYPGTIEGVVWNKARIRETLAPVLAFQKKYRVPILVGEFSAVRYAPDESARNYIRDCIEIFEEYEWDWFYHAFRTTFNGWSPEHSRNKDDNSPASKPTSVEILLKSYFAKNKKVLESP